MKELTPALREQYRISLLRYLATTHPRPLTEGVLLQFLRTEWSQPVDQETLAGLLSYLADKGLIVDGQKFISPEVKAWRITAAGMDEFARISGA